MYKKYPRNLVKIAIDIAEANIDELNTSFNILADIGSRGRHRFYTSDDEYNHSDDEYNHSEDDEYINEQNRDHEEEDIEY